MFITMISRRLAEYVTPWIILAETVIMLFVSIVMVQDRVQRVPREYAMLHLPGRRPYAD